VESFSLVADMMYVAQNAPRISRALFEICLRRKWSSAAATLLEICKVGGGVCCRLMDAQQGEPTVVGLCGSANF
jgi:hypothetical protein